jgi:hypothetical protein
MRRPSLRSSADYRRFTAPEARAAAGW